MHQLLGGGPVVGEPRGSLLSNLIVYKTSCFLTLRSLTLQKRRRRETQNKAFRAHLARMRDAPPGLLRLRSSLFPRPVKDDRSTTAVLPGATDGAETCAKLRLAVRRQADFKVASARCTVLPRLSFIFVIPALSSSVNTGSHRPEYRRTCPTYRVTCYARCPVRRIPGHYPSP